MIVTISTRIASGDIATIRFSDDVSNEVQDALSKVKTLANAIAVLERAEYVYVRTFVSKEFSLTIYAALS